MKKYYYLLFFFCCSLISFSQNKMSKLSNSETSIIFSSFPVIDIRDYQENTNSVYSYLQAYKGLSQNDIQGRLATLGDIEEKAKNDKQNGIVSLGLLNSDFEVINPNVISQGKAFIDNDGFLVQSDLSSNIFEKNNLSLLAPLQLNHKGLRVVYNLSIDLIYNTTNKEITNIYIDFDDGNGRQNISTDQNIVIKYSDKGSKIITTEIEFSDGSITTSKSSINIKYSNEDQQALFNRAPTTFTSTNTTPPNLTPYGVADDIGTGEYEVFLSADNVLDKPIFLVDGFDPGDGRDIMGIYDLLNFNDAGNPSNLADVVRAEGFDVIILNFPVYTRTTDMVEVDGGADFIERNAMLLVELINLINGQKSGDADNVIIGPSMGGLISRYALNFMENQGLDHETRLWLSFDSPHLGANVPIGFQYLFNKLAFGLQLGGLAGDQSVVSVRPLVDDFLRSPAARQMLTDHFDAHITSGTDFDNSLKLPQKNSWSPLFFDGLNALTTSGFPENTRNVSITNGSGIGSAYTDKNGMDILPDFLALGVENLSISGGLADADFESRFTPLAGQENTAGSVDIDAIFICFCDFSDSATVMAETFSDGIDAAPGGLFDISSVTGEIPSDPLVDAFFAGLNTDQFNFIPTVSAMALEVTNDEIDWFHDIDLGSGTPPNGDVLNITPFDNWYMPDANEPHVLLTEGNVDFALDEIILETLSNPEIDNLDFKIRKNPIQNQLTILTNQTFENSNISITDITGKIILQENRSLNTITTIPVNIASGMYILNIQTENQVFQTKLIVQ